jgi:hypothetical protein
MPQVRLDVFRITETLGIRRKRSPEYLEIHRGFDSSGEGSLRKTLIAASCRITVDGLPPNFKVAAIVGAAPLLASTGELEVREF